MGQAIVKAARDRDLYMVWSSVVDAPVAVGSRNQMVEYARQEWRDTPEQAEAALQRADTNGSSDRAMRFGWWDDETLPVMEGSPPDGWYHVRRDRLVDYAEALLHDDDAAAVALLECWQRRDDAS
jgi:hypothetical protein